MQKSTKKYKKQKVNKVQEVVDYGAKYIAQHGVYKIEDSSEGKRARNLTQIPLDYYYLRGWLSDDQYLAGLELFRLWYFGAEKNMYTQVKYSFEAKGFSGQGFEIRALLEEKYNAALEAIRGIKARKTCHAVCCIGEWASATNYVKNKLERMEVLKGALDDLAKHFGKRG